GWNEARGALAITDVEPLPSGRQSVWQRINWQKYWRRVTATGGEQESVNVRALRGASGHVTRIELNVSGLGGGRGGRDVHRCASGGCWHLPGTGFDVAVAAAVAAARAAASCAEKCPARWRRPARRNCAGRATLLGLGWPDCIGRCGWQSSAIAA